MVMNHVKTLKLKPLLDTVPPGFMVDARWLRGRDIDPKSIHDYVARGWLERVIRGVYRRPLPQSVQATGKSWEVALLSLQRLMGYNVYLGGESALNFAGHVHYLPLGESSRVYLYGDTPSWLARLPAQERIVVRQEMLFGGDPVGVVDTDFEANLDGWAVDVWRWPVRASSPERAILEALNELPGKASFEHIDRIFEGLVSLRPNLLMGLLTVCRSVKVRRLFFVFADRHEHRWRKYLDAARIDFGSGPRALVDCGKFHPIYRISVPRFLVSAKPASPESNA